MEWRKRVQDTRQQSIRRTLVWCRHQENQGQDRGILGSSILRSIISADTFPSTHLAIGGPVSRLTAMSGGVGLVSGLACSRHPDNPFPIRGLVRLVSGMSCFYCKSKNIIKQNRIGG